VAELLDLAPPAGEQAIFRADGVEVALEYRTTPDGHASEDCLVVASGSREVSDEAYAEFEHQLEILRTTHPPPKPLGSIRSGLIPPELVRWHVNPPASVVALCDDVRDELHGAASRLVQLLRWLFNRPWPSWPLGSPQLSWSLDGNEWNWAPDRPTQPDVFGNEGGTLTSEGTQALEAIWRERAISEPLARQIFLEAYALADENPRAALVLVVAAAEVAVKQFAARQSAHESEAWLISKLPSPPILTLLRDYVPFFTNKRSNDGRAVPRHLRSALHEAAEARNGIVHQGDSGYDEEQLASVFVTVNDLLYLLDWFAGHDWAFEHLQRETRAAYES
jgi:hypothetical protein